MIKTGFFAIPIQYKGLYTLDIFAHDIAIGLIHTRYFDAQYCDKKIILSH